MKKIGEFKIRTATGQEFIVIDWQASVPVGDLQDPHDTVPGARRLLTKEGWSVTEIGDGTYEIRKFGLKARRVS